jgi:hypothetical protein
VLYNAARAGDLVEVALDWEPTSTPEQLVSQIPRLAEAVLRLESLGLIEVFHRYSHDSTDGDRLFGDELRSTVTDPESWGLGREQTILVEVISTSWADSVFQSKGDEDLFSYHHHSA